jgi:hypothetical protein
MVNWRVTLGGETTCQSHPLKKERRSSQASIIKRHLKALNFDVLFVLGTGGTGALARMKLINWFNEIFLTRCFCFFQKIKIVLECLN